MLKKFIVFVIMKRICIEFIMNNSFFFQSWAGGIRDFSAIDHSKKDGSMSILPWSFASPN